MRKAEFDKFVKIVSFSSGILRIKEFCFFFAVFRVKVIIVLLFEKSKFYAVFFSVLCAYLLFRFNGINIENYTNMVGIQLIFVYIAAEFGRTQSGMKYITRAPPWGSYPKFALNIIL